MTTATIIGDTASLLSGIATPTNLNGFFGDLSKLSGPTLNVILSLIQDNAKLQQVAQWAEAYAQSLQVSAPSSEPSPATAEPNFDTSFFDAMKSTTYVGGRLTFTDLENAQASITAAIKSDNWKQAIWVGISIAELATAAGA